MKLLVVAALGALAALQSPGEADVVAARLHAYLLGYEPKLSELIADEDEGRILRGTGPPRLGRSQLLKLSPVPDLGANPAAAVAAYGCAA